MSTVKISELPAGLASGSSIVPATNAAGTATQKVTMASIAGLVTSASQLTEGTLNEALLPSGIVRDTDPRLSDPRAPLSHSHASADVSHDSTSSSLTATNVKDALDELAPQKIYNVTQDEYFDTIQSAIDAADANDVIEVAAGTYVVDVTLAIDKPLTLRGPNYKLRGDDPNRGPEATLVYGALPIYYNIISTDSSDVTFEGFNVEIPDALLLASPSVNYTIGWFSYSENNLVIRNNRWYGGVIPIYVYYRPEFAKKTGVVIEGNYLDGGPFVNCGASRGIYCADAAATIQDNVVKNFAIGIQHSQYNTPTPSFVRRNRISASSVGLYNNAHFRGGADVTYEYNSITIAPNDRAGLKTLVWGANTANVAFNGIQLTFMGVQAHGGPGEELPQPTVICSNNSVDMTRDASQQYNSVVLRGLRLNNNHPDATATVTNNSFVGWTVAAASNTDNGIAVDAANNWWGTESAANVVLDIGPPSTLGTGVAVSGDITIAPISTADNVGNGTFFRYRPFPRSSDVEFDNVASGLTATNTKAAIDELVTRINDKATVVAVPATSTSTGTPGQIAYDSSYVYICTAVDSWFRAPIATW